MSDNNKNGSFSYTYSAKEQEELENIRKKYTGVTEAHEDKMERLRRLDKSAAKEGTTAAIIVGVISTLIMGAGMSMCMVGTENMFFPGIVVGIIGIAGICMAYPVYSAVTKRKRKKLAPEVLRLIEELKK